MRCQPDCLDPRRSILYSYECSVQHLYNKTRGAQRNILLTRRLRSDNTCDDLVLQVWDIAGDPSLKYLRREDFYVAMRLIAMAQVRRR